MTIEQQLAAANAKVTDLEATVKAIMGERDTATANATTLTAERDTLKTTVATLTGERDKALADLATANTKISALEAADKDVKKQAATQAAAIVAQTGGTPVKGSDNAGAAGTDILAQYEAIKDPAAKTAFRRANAAALHAALTAANRK